MPSKDLFKKMTRPLGWLVVLLVAFLFGKTISDNWANVQDIEVENFNLLVLAAVLFTVAVLISGLIWGHLLSAISGKTISSKEAMRVHAASWILKYIPGQAGSYINKVAWASKNDISKKAASNSFIYENAMMLFAGILLASPLVLILQEVGGGDFSIFIPLLLVVPLLLVFNRSIFRWLLNMLFGMLKRDKFKRSDFLDSKKMYQYQLAYLLPRILNGLGFVFIAMAVMNVTPVESLVFAAAYILAGIVGLLAIFVPGGLGVREAVLVLFLTVYMPVEQAIVLAVLARLVATISDGLVALVYAGLKTSSINKKERRSI